MCMHTFEISFTAAHYLYIVGNVPAKKYVNGRSMTLRSAKENCCAENFTSCMNKERIYRRNVIEGQHINRKLHNKSTPLLLLLFSNVHLKLFLCTKQSTNT